MQNGCSAWSDDVLTRLINGHGDLVRTADQGVEEAASRKSDTAPFYGGAGIRLSGGTDKCSTGFTVKNAPRTYLGGVDSSTRSSPGAAPTSSSAASPSAATSPT